MAKYPTAKCPSCKQKRLWFGEGDPELPCSSCHMEQVPVDAEYFFKGAEQSPEVAVIRTRTSVTTEIGKRYVEQLGHRYFYQALVETESGWKYYTYSEVLVIDGWGNLGLKDSMWSRLKEAEIPVSILRNRSGAF